MLNKNKTISLPTKYVKKKIVIGDRHLNKIKQNLFNNSIQNKEFETKLAETICIELTSSKKSGEWCIFFAYGLPKQNKDLLF